MRQQAQAGVCGLRPRGVEACEALIREAVIREAKEKVSETPVMKRKKGKTRSVRVQPFQGECCS